MTSVFGRLTYERAYYAGCSCGTGKAPLDEQYGLEPGALTSGLAALVALGGIEFAFDESRAWMHPFLLFDVSENTVRAETQTMGQLQAAREKRSVPRARTKTIFKRGCETQGLYPNGCMAPSMRRKCALNHALKPGNCRKKARNGAI